MGRCNWFLLDIWQGNDQRDMKHGFKLVHMLVETQWLLLTPPILLVQPQGIDGYTNMYIYIYIYWLVVDLPLWKNMKVSWDCYSQHMEKHVPNHQPVYILQKNYWLGPVFPCISLPIPISKAGSHLVKALASPFLTLSHMPRVRASSTKERVDRDGWITFIYMYYSGGLQRVAELLV